MQEPILEPGYTRLQYQSKFDRDGLKAIKFEIDGDDFWIPRGQCSLPALGIVDVKDWWFENKMSMV